MFIAENKRPALRRSEERLDTTGFSHVVFQFSPSPREHTRNFKTPPTSVDKWSPGLGENLITMRLKRVCENSSMPWSLLV